MKEIVLNKVKEKYEELKVNNEAHKEIVKQYKRLKCSEELIVRAKRKIRDDKELLLMAFRSEVTPDKVDSNIYYLLGGFNNDNPDKENRFVSNEEAKFFIYLNIEHEEVWQLMLKEEKDNFEKNNIVISYDNDTLEESKIRYELIQNIYYEETYKNTKKESIIEKVKKIK